VSALTRWMDRTWYPKHAKNWDDELFREEVLLHLGPDVALLDLGAGAGIVSQMNFRGRAGRVCGVDLDPRVVDNPFLDEGKVSDAGGIPYADGTFDVVISDNVLEHLDRPEEVFREVARVLRPGGVFLFKTPNKWHYMPTIARITPHGFHQFVNRIRGRAHVDTFPTRYRANTRSSILSLAERTGFSVVSVKRIEGRPEYLRMTAATYMVGVFYERLVNITEMLAPFRVLLVGVLRKK
jgi:SAM-dependent methyltransferase